MVGSVDAAIEINIRCRRDAGSIRSATRDGGNGPGPAALFALAAGICSRCSESSGSSTTPASTPAGSWPPTTSPGSSSSTAGATSSISPAGLLALGFAARQPRRTAAAVGASTSSSASGGSPRPTTTSASILEVLPLRDEDNVFHLLIGGLGTIAALADGPLPKLPAKPKRRRGGRRTASGTARRAPGVKPPAASSRSRA